MRATLWLLVSAVSFSLMGVCVKQVGGRIPVSEVVLVRAVLSVAMTWWLLRRAGVRPWGQRRGLLVWRGVVGTGALLCVYQALTLLPLASATVLQYLYPTFTALLAWLVLGERIGRQVLAAMLVGWLGVGLVAQPWGGDPIPFLGLLAALAGALLTAVAYVSVRSLGSSEHPLVIIFYFPLVAIPLMLPLVALDPVLPNGQEAAWLVGVALFTQLGQIGITRGLTQLPAARATTVGYVQVAFAGLWGVLVFGEAIDRSTALGALLIFLATLLSFGSGGGRGKTGGNSLDPRAPGDSLSSGAAEGR